MKILITRDGRQSGPYSLVEVEKMVEAGTLQLDDLAKYEDRSGWVRLRKLPGFFYRPAYAPAKFETRALKIFITRNGQKAGPCSLAEVQNMVNAGTIQLTDLARYEDQSDWVRLDQLPGFFTRPTPVKPRAGRPVLVWIISILFFVSYATGLISLIIVPAFPSGTFAGMKAQHSFLQSLSWLHYSLFLIGGLINLVFSIQLFRLRRQAFTLYLLSIALSLLLLPYNILTEKVHIPIEARLTILAPLWAINIALLIYVWSLCKKGVLR